MAPLSTTAPHRPRRARGRTLLLMVLTALLSGALVAVAPAANAVSCKRTTTKIGSQWKEHRYTEEYIGGGQVRTYGHSYTTYDSGSMNLTVETCYVDGAWKTFSSTQRYGFRHTVTDDRHVWVHPDYSMGFVLTRRKLNQASIVVQTSKCRKGSFWSGLANVVGLPIPAPPAVSVGLWVTGQLIPRDGTDCDAGPRVRIPFTRSRGVVDMKDVVSYGPVFVHKTPLGDISLVSEYNLRYTTTHVSTSSFTR